jgi:hypothetical protein
MTSASPVEMRLVPLVFYIFCFQPFLIWDEIGIILICLSLRTVPDFSLSYYLCCRGLMFFELFIDDSNLSSASIYIYKNS